MGSGLHSDPKPASRHWQERRNRHRGDRGSCDSRARVRCWRAKLGWPLYDAMFLAAVLSIGSTAILVKVLEDMGRMESTSAILMI